MIYRQRNKKRNTPVKIIGGFILLLIILRLFGVNIFGGFIGNSVNYVLESEVAMLSPLKNTFAYFQSKADLEEARKNLAAENMDLKLQQLTSQSLSEEFRLFNEQFGQFSADTRALKVILRPPFTPFDILRVSGNFDVHEEGDLVFFRNVVIGTIAQKSGNYGTANLFSSPGTITPATMKGTQFEARGQGGGRFVMEVARDFDVAIGDPILYPHQELILLGAVEEIETAEENLFKKVYFNTPVPLASISFVTIGKQTYEQDQPDN